MKTFKKDFFASIVVFLVALPLCLGIALASGAPLFSGLIAGIVGGVVVGILSGSSLGVSGPGAGLAAVVLYSIDTLKSFEVFLLAVMIAGVMQIFLGLIQAGQVRHYFPVSVIKGMLAGIGLVIILKQIPHLMGYNLDPEGDFAFSQLDGHTTLNELYYMLWNVNYGSIIISVAALCILGMWSGPLSKFAFARVIPGSLVAVLLGILISQGFKASGYFVLAKDQMVNIMTITSFSDFFSKLQGPDFTLWYDSKVYLIAALIAAVASLETLLCLEATDKLDPLKRKTSAERELLAQGAGNIVSGFLGGLPITQVIVRSSANIQSGGQSKISAILHGLFLFLFVCYASFFLNQIPLATLAAILLLVGFKLASPSVFKESFKENLSYSLSFVTTILGTVFSDLLTGIFSGFVMFHTVAFLEKKVGQKAWQEKAQKKQA